jgi:serine/threonine-protein kinase SRPK3
MADYYVTYQETNPSSRLNATDEEGFDSIEEGLSVYVSGGFHPVGPGQVYHERYQIIRKLGFGKNSTVWLAEDKRYMVAFDGD